MDSEELSSLCSSLALEEDEEALSPDLEAGLQAQGERSIDRSLLGCILSTGPIGRDAFVHMIRGVWKTKERFEVEAIGNNKFIFHFLSTADKRRVMSGGPWCFQNKLLVLEEPTGVGDYSKMSFSKAPFWIQLHNIPVFCMSKTVGSILGNMVGFVQEIECNQDGLCLGNFIRVRVIIDVTKPLKRILKVRLGADKELVTILIRYEHLPELCFRCGVIGHPLKECPEKESCQGDDSKLKYGAWIKAPLPQSGSTLPQSKRRRPSSGPSHYAPPQRKTNPQPSTSPSPKNRQRQYPAHRPLERTHTHPAPNSRYYAPLHKVHTPASGAQKESRVSPRGGSTGSPPTAPTGPASSHAAYQPVPSLPSQSVPTSSSNALAAIVSAPSTKPGRKGNRPDRAPPCTAAPTPSHPSGRAPMHPLSPASGAAQPSPAPGLPHASNSDTAPEDVAMDTKDDTLPASTHAVLPPPAALLSPPSPAGMAKTGEFTVEEPARFPPTSHEKEGYSQITQAESILCQEMHMGGGPTAKLYEVPVTVVTCEVVPHPSPISIKNSKLDPFASSHTKPSILSPSDNHHASHLGVGQGSIFGYNVPNNDKIIEAFAPPKHSSVDSNYFVPSNDTPHAPIRFTAESKKNSSPSLRRKKKPLNLPNKNLGPFSLSPSKSLLLGRPPTSKKRKNLFPGSYAFPGNHRREGKGNTKTGKICIENIEKVSDASEALPSQVGDGAFTNKISALPAEQERRTP